MKRILTYLKYKQKLLMVFGSFFLIFILCFYLYGLPLEAVVYPFALCLLLGAAFLAADYAKTVRTCSRLEGLKNAELLLSEELPKPQTPEGEAFLALIQSLLEKQRLSAANAEASAQNVTDYYTMWVHQIKVPIASMKLSLQATDSDQARKLLADLGRIEGYVNMVLTYLRLESDTTDYRFQDTTLDPLLKNCIRSFRSDFISKRISLNYSKIEAVVLTDEKWLSFVIEQLLSNALKYTAKGSISIAMEGDTLTISDTGMGIAPEDLPRIFERSYTGFNGRQQKAASGIGLYLCKRICNALAIDLQAQSTPGLGTTMSLTFQKKMTDPE